MKKFLLLPLYVLSFASCTSQSEVIWFCNASKIDIFYVDYHDEYVLGDYYSLQYIEKDFLGIDIRYKVTPDDEYVIKEYRHVTYVITLLPQECRCECHC